MDSLQSPSPSSSSGGRRGGHLKRLSLSVGAGGSSASPSHSVHDMLAKSSTTTSTPDRAASPASRDSMSPLHRSLGSGRRQRPMSMYAGANSGPTSPLSAGHTSLAALDATLSTPSSSSSSAASTSTATFDHHPEQHQAEGSDSTNDNSSIAHPLAGVSSPSSISESPVTSPPGSANALRNSTGRRSILGRSAHARRQSSISYARSPSNDSPSHHIGSNTSIGTPRTSLSAIRDEDEENVDNQNESSTAGPSSIAHQTPSKSNIIADNRSRGDSVGAFSGDDSMSSQHSLMGTSPSSINEMSIGPGARSSDLLTFIAKKERKCLDLREELQRHESELAALKKKWEIVIQREMQASTSSAASSSNMSPSNSQPGAASSLFSSLTSTLTASTSSSSNLSSSSHTASGATVSGSIGSPSPQSGNGASRRLLTNRHSISVASPSSSSSLPYFGGGADLSPQTSPLSALNNAQQQQSGNSASSLDVQKIAKSWLGGVMKSASNVLEGLAPPPPTNDLGTVAEEDEPEEDEEDRQYDRHTSTNNRNNNGRTSAGHPSRSSPHNRKESTATNITSTSEMSSPSSSCEDGQFSSGLASRSSSVSSLHSDNGGRDKEDESSRGDTTPIATPVLPQYGGTPRATPANGDEERDLWALSGDFEDDSAREKREVMERNRIDVATGSPVKETSKAPASSRPTMANHGRRRSTAFELGGAWGAMVGKKWNEMASQLSANETLKASSKKAMGLMEGFERSLNEAITPDPANNEGGNTHLMLVNGELIPTGDWSPVSSPQQQHHSQGHAPQYSPRDNRQNDLPSGIGGPATWSALLGRTKSNNTPNKSPQSEYTWTSNGIEEKARSPSLSNESRSDRSLLDDDNEEDTSQDPLNVSSSASATRRALSPTPLTAQERIQASRAKHAKRMSMPVNTVSHSNKRAESPASAKKETFGLGLEGVNENEEDDEGAWGW